MPPAAPHLPDLISNIELSRKPWIAVVHGTALGGGCEVTLGCHYRLAVSSAKFGLPEVHLGLIPGAGGTVRLPRIVGVEKSISMVTSGKPISAKEAQSVGLVDEIISETNMISHAVDFAKNKLTASMPVAVSQRAVPDIPSQENMKAILDGVAAKAKGQLSPVEAAGSIIDSLSLDAGIAFAQERERFVALKESDQSAALRHVFFAERQTAKLDEIKDTDPLTIAKCGVVGGGTMGAGIATAMLLGGLKVTLSERGESEAEAARSRVVKTLEGSLSRSLINEAQFNTFKDNFETTANLEGLADSDLVIEAIFEDMDLKKSLFKDLSGICSKETIFATNTSYLDANKMSADIPSPERFIGLHFFSPAHIMKLLEVIKTETVSRQVLATAFSLAKRLRKTPVLSGVCDGFIGNRILANYRKQCDYMLEDGAAPQDIDAAMRNFGMAMGPFEMQDMAGLDIGWANRKRLAPTRDPNERYVKIADKICELGRFGQKTSAGWYQYPSGSRKGIPDPIVETLIDEERKAAGITPRTFTMSEIQSRILQAMVSEGQKILDEGIARSAADIDMVFILGYGFPRWRGGPMFAGGVRD